MDFTYANLQMVSEAMGETNDCGLIATSIVTRTGYKRVHETYSSLGRKKRCGVDTIQISKAINSLGFSEEREYMKRKHGKRITVNKIGLYYPNGKYIAITRTHALALVDGKVQDWTEGRKHQVLFVMKIEETSKGERK